MILEACRSCDDHCLLVKRIWSISVFCYYFSRGAGLRLLILIERWFLWMSLVGQIRIEGSTEIATSAGVFLETLERYLSRLELDKLARR